MFQDKTEANFSLQNRHPVLNPEPQPRRNRALSPQASLLCGKDFLAVIGVLGDFCAAATPEGPALGPDLGAFFPTVGRAATSARPDVEGPPPAVRLPVRLAAVTLMLLFVMKPDDDEDDEEFAS